MKYTKGPWRAEAGHDNEGSTIDTEIEIWGSIMSVDDWCIARIWNDGLNPEKDAHLIAAAPDMYEVLKKLLSYAEDDYEISYQIGEKTLDMLRRAIAKAEGK